MIHLSECGHHFGKNCLQNYLVPEKCCDRLCMVSWFSIIPGLAALQQTEWTERKNPKQEVGVWPTVCLLFFVICLLG